MEKMTKNCHKLFHFICKYDIISASKNYRPGRGDDMIKKEMIAMLLAGGQGSRLGVLTSKVAKPAVDFGGKYRIIVSRCIKMNLKTC